MVYHSTVQPDNVQPSDFLVTACVLSLASNVEPSHHLAFAQSAIKKLGTTDFSPITISPALADEQSHLSSYHNQVVYLTLNTPIQYAELVNLTKSIEQQANRGQYQKPWVTLDVDVIAVKADTDESDWQESQWQDEKGERFLTFTKLPNWLGIARRFPLASYDKQGILALAEQADLGFLQYLA